MLLGLLAAAGRDISTRTSATGTRREVRLMTLPMPEVTIADNCLRFGSRT
jgi:hypothetical protein